MTASTTSTISSPELRNRLDTRLDSKPSFRVLDVRTPAEYETAHIAGSYNLPLDVLRDRQSDVVEHLDDDVVLVCQSGQRAEQARDLLSKGGISGGRVLHGGIADWESQGFAVDRGAQRWALERQVRLVAGSIVLTSVLGSVAVPKLKWLAAAIGGGLTYAAVSNTCAMAAGLAKLPYNRGAKVDADDVVSGLAG
jgi:rhodanese-related sulfurtransferase